MTTTTRTIIIDPQSKALSERQQLLLELKDDQVRLQVLYSGISNNDILYLDGLSTKDYFGVEVVGKIVALGKNALGRKLNEVVGISFDNVNHGQFTSGFSTYIQTSINNIVYIPNTIKLDHAAGLLGSGLVAFNALEKLQKGQSVAIVGTNNIAYLAVQFAIKAFGLKATVFYTGNPNKDMGADAYEQLTTKNVHKFTERFEATILTEKIPLDLAKVVQNLSIRTGKVYVCTHLGYNPQIIFFQLVIFQRQFTGVKRGASKRQMVKMLEAAAFHGITGRIQSFDRKSYNEAFHRARQTNSSSDIILKY